MNPEEAELARTMQRLPGRFSDRLDADDIDALHTMAEAGEWAEEADLLIATLATQRQPVTNQEREDLQELLHQMELPSDELKKVRTADVWLAALQNDLPRRQITGFATAEQQR